MAETPVPVDRDQPSPLRKRSLSRPETSSHVPHPELAISDPPQDNKLASPLREALGQRRGSLKDAQHAREQVRRASIEAAKRTFKGKNSELKKFFATHSVSELKTTSKVIEIDGSLKPLEGFEILLKHNILSAPVYDAESKSYTGFLDVRDLVASIVHVHQNHKHKYSSLLTVAVTKIGGDTEPPSLIYLSRRNPFKPVLATSKLAEVALIIKAKNIHRVPVVNEEGKCVQIISQSTILQFIAANKDEIAGDTKQTIEEINLGLAEVVTVGSHEPAILAFQTIEKTGYSGLGVVDNHGKLIGNTSARDIKYIVLDKGEGDLSLESPVLEYLAQIRQREITASDRAPVCTVQTTATLARVIGLLGATQYHRIFLVDHAGKPIGVVSVTDILHFATADLEA